MQRTQFKKESVISSLRWVADDVLCVERLSSVLMIELQMSQILQDLRVNFSQNAVHAAALAYGFSQV